MKQTTALKRSLAPLIALVCASCSGHEDDEFGSVSQAVVLGTIAGESDLPSTLWMNGCTGSKVGPRHFLTAGHCVSADGIKLADDKDPGDIQKFSTQNVVGPNDSLRELVIESAHAELYLKSAANPATMDVGLVIVEQETPEIPIAPVLEQPLQPGDEVIINGMGCETDGVNGQQLDGHRLRFQKQKVQAPEQRGSSPNDTASFFSTPGLARDPSGASLCPGDSGGPVFREVGGELTVVGVNSFISGSPVNFNGLTRIDSSAKRDVFTWLQGLGVTTRPMTEPRPFHGIAFVLPGTLQAEDFDIGKPGLTYQESDRLNYPSGSYRSEPVDIDPLTAEPGNYDVGGIEAGDWLSYSIESTADKRYDLAIRAASWSAATLHLELDGTSLTPAIALTQTGGIYTFVDNLVPGIRIGAGRHRLRVAFESEGLNLDSIKFTESPPTCTDQLKNGSEADVDCGASCPAKCPAGKACQASADCQDQNCVAGSCAAPQACTDFVKNGSESDVDCGGHCSPCADGSLCALASDCRSSTCTAGRCAAAVSCTDGIKNGTEPDIDCGSTCPGRCATGKQCVQATDCATRLCTSGLCQAPAPGAAGSSSTNGNDNDSASSPGCTVSGAPGPSYPAPLALLGLALLRSRRRRRK